jgi:ADP-ribose pyrophosphatase YjhB (NUDIX family)
MPHIHEKVDFTVEAFIVYNDTVLLRKHDKYNKWLSVGGHIELDEDPNQAILREIKEEVGLDAELYYNDNVPLEKSNEYKELIPPIFLNRHRINHVHEHVSLTYFARSKTDELSFPEGKTDCHWFTTEELDNPSWGIEKRIAEQAKIALKTLKGV